MSAEVRKYFAEQIAWPLFLSVLLEFNKANLIPIYTASRDTFPHVSSYLIIYFVYFDFLNGLKFDIFWYDFESFNVRVRF